MEHEVSLLQGDGEKENIYTESAGSSFPNKEFLSISAMAVTNALNVVLTPRVTERPCDEGLLVKLRVSTRSQNGRMLCNPYD